MQGHGQKLTRNQEKAVAALLAHPSIAAAARAVGVSEKTLDNWLKLPRFRKAFDAVRRQALTDALGDLQRVVGEAVETLKRNLTCGLASVEVKAAGQVLTQVVRCTEFLEIKERVEALEERINAETTGNGAKAAG